MIPLLRIRKRAPWNAARKSVCNIIAAGTRISLTLTLIEEKSIATLILLPLTWITPISNYVRSLLLDLYNGLYFEWILQLCVCASARARACVCVCVCVCGWSIVLIENTWNRCKQITIDSITLNRVYIIGRNCQFYLGCMLCHSTILFADILYVLSSIGILIIFAVIEFLNSASARWYATMVPNRFSPRCQVVSSVHRERIINCYLSVLINCCSRLSLSLICEISTWRTECALSPTDFDNIL